MTVRIVEGKKPYTWGDAINIDDDKVISLRLRDENNLIIYDEGDDEIYVDLQLESWIEPTDAFPVWVNTGRVLVADWWDKTGTLVVAKTTSWDNIQLLYADDWTLWMDNGTWTFKQVYFKWDIDTALADKQDEHIQAVATLEANDWNNSTQTITVEWVTATNTVIITPIPSDLSNYASAWIYCSAQWTDSLTFTCDTTPSNAIDVNVVILN